MEIERVIQVQEKEDRKTDNKPTAPLISVIVPIYNVEKYVRKCLDSLRGQTLREIEMVCIDDGSTDRSGAIANEFARDDERFRVIHTENRGLSAARNRGIDEARTDWLMFVDSDDWVSPDFCRVPYEAAIENQADLVIFRSYRVINGIEEKDLPDGIIGIINEQQADKLGGNAVWRRLYKKELFMSIRYPVGRVYEDIATTHRLAHVADKILMLSNILYYHVYREDSISNSKSVENKRDFVTAEMEKCLNFISYGFPENKDKLPVSSIALSYLIRNSKERESLLYKKAVEIVDKTKGIPRELSAKKKIELIIWKIDRRLFHLLSIFLQIE